MAKATKYLVKGNDGMFVKTNGGKKIPVTTKNTGLSSLALNTIIAANYTGMSKEKLLVQQKKTKERDSKHVKSGTSSLTSKSSSFKSDSDSSP